MIDKILELANEEQPTTWLDKVWRFLLVFAFAGFLIGMVFYMKRDRVDQGVMKFSSCGCTMFYTSVWINDEIVKLWTTDAASMTDSVKAAQKKEGERILHANK